MSTVSGYSRKRIALHWIAFALIAQQYIFHDAISGAWDQILKGVEVAFNPLVMMHVLGGALVLLLAIWRLALRARHGAPAPLATSKAQIALSKLTLLGLYAVMILLPVSGSAAWFGGVEAAAKGHNVMKVILLALVALHVAGALYHQFVLRDGTLARMRRAED